MWNYTRLYYYEWYVANLTKNVIFKFDIITFALAFRKGIKNISKIKPINMKCALLTMNITNSMAYETRSFNAAFTRALQ